jgi:hypothetical protein
VLPDIEHEDQRDMPPFADASERALSWLLPSAYIQISRR